MRVDSSPYKTKYNKRVRLNYILSKKLIDYQMKPVGTKVKPTSRAVGLRDQTYKPAPILDYTSIKRLEKIIRSLTSLSTLEPSARSYYRDIINNWVDVIKPAYIFPSVRRTSSFEDSTSYKWLSLYRVKKNLSLRQDLYRHLIALLHSRESNAASSIPSYYRWNRGWVDHEFYVLRHKEEYSRTIQQHFILGTIFMVAAKYQQNFFRSLRDLKTLLMARKQQIKTILLALTSAQIHAGQDTDAGSAGQWQQLLEFLWISIYLTEHTKGLDKALSFMDINRSTGDMERTQLPSYSVWGPNKDPDQVLALLARSSTAQLNTGESDIKWLETLDQRYKKLKRRRRQPILTEIIECRAVSRTRAGGRTRRFRVLVAIGRKAGWVGVGVGKHKYIPEAVEQARRKAAKNIVRLRRTSGGSIPHEVQGNYKKAQVLLKPLSVGSGLMTGPCLKDILSLAGYTNMWGLQMGTSNRICNIRACMNALGQLRSEAEISAAQRSYYTTSDPYLSLFSALKTYVNL